MEETNRHKLERFVNEHPIKGANFISQLFFCWPLPIFYKGLKTQMEEHDLYEVLEEHDSNELGDKFEKEWIKEVAKRKPSLWNVLRRVFFWETCFLGFLLFTIELGIKLVHPICLSRLMLFYGPNQNQVTQQDAYICAGLIILASFLNVLVGHQLMFRNLNLGMKMRVACCSLVYRKALRLSRGALIDTTVGQMVNLLSNDVNRFDYALTHLHNIWVAPVQVLVIMIIMYFLIDPVCLLGIAFLSLFIPFQIYLSELTSRYRFKIASRTDERVRLMNEIICGMQVIKMYAWEKSFAKLVELARKREVSKIQATSYIRALLLSLSMFMNRTAIFICVLSYVLTGNTLTAYYVFVVTAFYNLLRVSMTMHFPYAMGAMAEVRVSIKRLEKFLMREEVYENKSVTQKLSHFSEAKGTGDSGVWMKNVSAKWFQQSEENTLNDVDFSIKSNKLVAVVGPVGSGKSSLLNIILKELHMVNGFLEVRGRISYASQEPWLFGGSVRQNILFGENLDLRKYSEVVRACSLESDFRQLPYGDKTVVGERGVMLSGGQKARINLARAIYKDADIYLLDDPLSAVDTHVGKHLFEECIKGFLKNKNVILVTHQLQYLRAADRIYVVDEGKMEMFKTYDDFKKSDTSVKDIMDNKTQEEQDPSTSDRITSITEYETPVEIREQKQKGSVGSGVYLHYLKAAGGYPAGVYVLLLFVVTQCAASLGDFFNGYWVNWEQKKHGSAQSRWDSYLSTYTCIFIYSGLVTVTILTSLWRSMQFMYFCMRASKRMHNRMFSSVVNATMRFFNTNTSGRILNRFSKDIGAIDEIMPLVILDTIQIGFNVISITIVVSLINPWTLLVTGLIVLVFYVFRIIFLKSSRNIKRIEATTRSPVFTHLSASLQGLATIRAFNAERILRREFDNLQNIHSSAYYLFTACNRAFGFWLDIHCVIYIAAVTISFLITDTEQYGGNVGLAITQSLALTGMFQWGMRQWSEWENQMTSVERVLEYTKLEPEPQRSRLLNEQWPEFGSLKFENVYLKYAADETYVLNNVNFEVRPKEKIGIVGRTGAGKSSIMYCLFLLAPIEGKIYIDGVVTSTICLEQLRSKISIIPQEPVLFSGTLRKNLDPFEEYDDETIWSALEDVELKTMVSDMPNALDSRMEEGGSNFSVGQRQLFCLARAIIRKNKILVMDEATANVDPNTDELIQRTIRKKFDECTVLTIAHRLHTVMDSDRILVMDKGRVVEFGHPHVLMKNIDGIFYGMISETGNNMAKSLMKIASDNYKS